MFARQKPAGWAFGERLLSGQMNGVDTNLANAIDGLNGGTYVLLSSLVLDGAPFIVNAAMVTNGPLDIGGTCNFLGGATFQNGAGFFAPATFNAAATFAVAAVFNGNVTIGNALSDVLIINAQINSDVIVVGLVSCSSVVTGDITAHGNCAIGDAAGDSHSVTGPIAFNHVVTLNDVAVCAGAGRLRKRNVVITDTGDRTVTIATGDILISRTLGANRVWTVGATGASAGDEIEIFNGDPSNTITVQDDDSVPTQLGIIKSTPGYARSLRCIFDLKGNGRWGTIGLEDAS